MKRFVYFVFVLCTGIIGLAFADTININWKVGDSTYDTSTCTVGGDLILPTAPTKRGHHFVGWRPTPYLHLEYIESTGTQYINTELNTKNFDISIKYEFTIQPGTTDQLLFGSIGSAGVGLYYFDVTAGGGWIRYGTIRSPNITSAPVTNTIYTIDVRNGVWYMNNNLLLDASDQADFISSQKFSIFSAYGSSVSNYGKYRCYYFKIIDNDTLVRNLLPAKRSSDNAIGMYDTVTGTFFENAGTGTFIAGPIVGGI